MTETCLPIVTWLKNWFTSTDDLIYYNISASNYNPTIDSTVTITVTVTDGNDDPVTSHSFTLNANGTDVSLTTNSSGVATHTYTCSNWGVHTFNVETSNCQIKVKGYKQTVNDTNYQVYENEEHYYVVINTDVTFSSTSWAGVFTIPEPYRPLIHIPLSCSDKQVNGRFTSTGAVQVINLTTTQRTTGVTGICIIKK